MTLILDHSRRSQPSALARAAQFAGRVALGAVRAIVGFVEREIDRRQTMALLDVDAHLLRDIGITRSDVYSALLTPAGEKPSEHLADVRSTRRAAERAAALEVRDAVRSRKA